MPTNWDQEEFWRKAAEKVAARKKRYGKARKAEQPEKPKSRNDRRDAFIYRHALNTDLTWFDIKAKLAATKRWRDDPLALGTSVEGVRAAANRYAKRHGLPAVPPRKSGRPQSK